MKHEVLNIIIISEYVDWLTPAQMCSGLNGEFYCELNVVYGQVFVLWS